MFIKTGRISELIKVLQENVGRESVIHYSCYKCGDEQVTYSNEIEQEEVDSLLNKNYIMTDYRCTKCGAETSFLYDYCIQGIELSEEINKNDSLFSLSGWDVAGVLEGMKKDRKVRKSITEKEVFDLVKNKLDIPWTEHVEALILSKEEERNEKVNNVFVGKADWGYFIDIQCNEEHVGPDLSCCCENVDIVEDKEKALKIGKIEAEIRNVPLLTDWD